MPPRNNLRRKSPNRAKPTTEQDLCNAVVALNSTDGKTARMTFEPLLDDLIEAWVAIDHIKPPAKRLRVLRALSTSGRYTLRTVSMPIRQVPLYIVVNCVVNSQIETEMSFALLLSYPKTPPALRNLLRKEVV
jgi:hypothetical protein